MKRFLSFALTLAIVVTLLPVNVAKAASPYSFSDLSAKLTQLTVDKTGSTYPDENHKTKPFVDGGMGAFVLSDFDSSGVKALGTSLNGSFIDVGTSGKNSALGYIMYLLEASWAEYLLAEGAAADRVLKTGPTNWETFSTASLMFKQLTNFLDDRITLVSEEGKRGLVKPVVYTSASLTGGTEAAVVLKPQSDWYRDTYGSELTMSSTNRPYITTSGESILKFFEDLMLTDKYPKTKAAIAAGNTEFSAVSINISQGNSEWSFYGWGNAETYCLVAKSANGKLIRFIAQQQLTGDVTFPILNKEQTSESKNMQSVVDAFVNYVLTVDANVSGIDDSGGAPVTNPNDISAASITTKEQLVQFYIDSYKHAMQQADTILGAGTQIQPEYEVAFLKAVQKMVYISICAREWNVPMWAVPGEDNTGRLDVGLKNKMIYLLECYLLKTNPDVSGSERLTRLGFNYDWQLPVTSSLPDTNAAGFEVTDSMLEDLFDIATGEIITVMQNYIKGAHSLLTPSNLATPGNGVAYIWPLEGTSATNITTPYSQTNQSIVIASGTGLRDVRLMVDGTLEFCGDVGGSMGYYVKFKHASSNTYTLYTGLDSSSIPSVLSSAITGQFFPAGTTLGKETMSGVGIEVWNDENGTSKSDPTALLTGSTYVPGLDTVNTEALLKALNNLWAIQELIIEGNDLYTDILKVKAEEFESSVPMVYYGDIMSAIESLKLMPEWSTITALYGGTIPNPNSLNKNDVADSNVTVSPVNMYVINASIIDGALIFDDPNNPTMTKYGYAFFEASSVYLPFISQAGNDPYFDKAVEAVLGMTTSEAEKVLANHRVLAKYVKPLYYRTINSVGKPEGSAQRITVKEFLDKLDNEYSSGALVTVKGVLSQAGVDSGTWQYTYLDPDVDASGVVNSSSTTVGSPSQSNSAPGSMEDIWGGSGQDGVASVPAASDEVQTAIDNSNTKQDASLQRDFLSVKIPDTDTIVDERYMTDSIFRYGADSSGVPALSYLVLRNILNDVKGRDSILASISNKYLWVNALGDIVFDDGTIFIPAAANPTYYADSTGMLAYSVALMSHYPIMGVNGNMSQFTNSRDEGKFIILENTQGGYYVGQLSDIDKPLLKARSMQLVTPQAKFNMNEVDPTTGLDTGTLREVTESALNYTAETNGARYLVKDKEYSTNDGPLFHSSLSDNVGYYNAYAIVRLFEDNIQGVAIKSLANTTPPSTPIMINESMLARIIGEAFLGTNSPSKYSSSVMNSYDSITRDAGGRFGVWLRETNKELLDYFGDETGIIGLKNAYENTVFSTLLRFLRTYFPFVILVAVLICLTGYLRKRFNAIFMAAAMLIIAGASYVFVYILPIYLPAFYNSIANNITENLGYNSIAYKAERYDQLSSYSSSSGAEAVPMTTSITIFSMSEEQAEEFRFNYNLSDDDFFSDKRILIDPGTGLYSQGPNLKVNVDYLLKNYVVAIKNSSLSLGEASVAQEDADAIFTDRHYELWVGRTNGELLSYYMPYDSIMGSFSDNLNSFVHIFKMPRSFILYPKGFTRDSFLVYNFSRSAIFMTPDNLEQIAYNIRADDLDYKNFILQKVKESFPNPHDFLGLKNILYSDSPELRTTLWWKTLQQNGYYDIYGVPTEELEGLISYVNYHTKKFILDMGDNIKYMSDENLIKIIALRACIAMNQRASNLGNWLYPNSINYQELSLTNVLTAAVVHDYDLYYQGSLEVTQYTSDKYGWLAQACLLVCVVLSYLIVNFMNLIIPVLYLGLYIILLLRLVLTKRALPVVRGYLKVSIILFILYSLFCLSFVVTSGLSGSPWCIFVLMMFLIVIVSFMLRLIISLLSNVLDFGDRTVTTDMKHMLDRVTFGLTAAASLAIANLKANKITNQRAVNNISAGSYNVYSMGESIHAMNTGAVTSSVNSKSSMRRSVGPSSPGAEEFYSQADLKS